MALNSQNVSDNTTIRMILGEELFLIIPLLRVLNKTITETLLRERLSEMVGQGYQCAGLYEDGRLIGICGLWVLTKYYVGKHIEPDNLVILEEYRGRGFGKRLMAWVHEYGKSQGAIASELNCYLSNKRGNAFWEREGYRKIAWHCQRPIQ
ncbi:MAG: GNAT family N-acetyltransferase [Leptospirillum sp.]